MTAPTTLQAPRSVRDFVRFLATGESEGLFAPDVTTEMNFPHVRMQQATAEALLALRHREHPGLTEVHVERLDLTERGWVIQLQERWERGGRRWYSREMFRADLEDERIVDLAVYCSGDWDEALQ